MEKKTYTSQILKIEEVAKHTYAVFIEKPKGFNYVAGQFTGLHLIKPKVRDPKGDYRWFSIPAAPFEKDLMFVFRKSDSPFKEQLLKHKKGDKVILTEPEGMFVLPKKTDKDIIFLTGGVGITPIRSMTQQSLHDSTGQKMTLFYSNFTPEETAFFKELSEIPQEKVKIVFTMTGMEHSYSQWNGETTHIDAAMIKKYEPDYKNKLFYIVGPPGFVTAMIQLMRAEGIGFSQIKLESFGGY